MEDVSEQIAKSLLQKRRRYEARVASERKKVKSGEDPPKKKTPSRIIKMTPEAEKRILKCMGCSAVYSPVLGCGHLYSALSNEPILYHSYPVVLEKPDRKGCLPSRYAQGVSQPGYVFTALELAFSELYPDEPGISIRSWEPYNWNVLYYGLSIAKRALNSKHLRTALLVTHSYGGTKRPQVSCIANELHRHNFKTYSVPISEVDALKDKALLSLNELKDRLEEAESLSCNKEFIKKTEDLINQEREISSKISDEDSGEDEELSDSQDTE